MANEFSQRRRNKISEKLSRSLGPEYLSVRQGCGSAQLTYVEGWLVINIANKIFGFDGWSSKIKRFTREYMEMKDGKINVGFSCCCRVTLKDGTYKEDVGFGSADSQKIKGLAIEKAKKEASTDALKRALRQFGNALGNCCYDKEFQKNVHKQSGLKKTSFDAKKLLRHSDIFDSREPGDVSISFSQDLSDL